MRKWSTVQAVLLHTQNIHITTVHRVDKITMPETLLTQTPGSIRVQRSDTAARIVGTWELEKRVTMHNRVFNSSKCNRCSKRHSGRCDENVCALELELKDIKNKK